MSTLLPCPEPDQPNGRSQAERAVLAGLTRVAATTSGLSWTTNAYMHVHGQRRELDVLVAYRGRAFGMEVDGPHHSAAGPVRG